MGSYSTRRLLLTALAFFFLAAAAQFISCSVLLRTPPLSTSKEEVGILLDDPTPGASKGPQTNTPPPDIASTALGRSLPSLEKKVRADKKYRETAGRLEEINRQTAGVIVVPGWKIEAEYYSEMYSDEEQPLSVIALRSLPEVRKAPATKTLVVQVEADSFTVRPNTPQQLALTEGAKILFTYKPIEESEGFRQLHVRVQNPAFQRLLEVQVLSPPAFWGLNEKQWQKLIQLIAAAGGLAGLAAIFAVFRKERTK